MIEYAATIRCRWLAQATWSGRQGFGCMPGPLVRPRTTNSASSVGIGAPFEILCGIPNPAGHCGHETSAPRTPAAPGAAEPGAEPDGCGGALPVACAWAEAASDSAAEARLGSIPP